MHDVVIVGTGPVGGTLALAIADADLDVVALDARAPGTTLRRDRSLALSHGARLIFERLGVWSRLASTEGGVTPIAAIDISQTGGFGMARLTASEQELPALGYVASYVALQNAIDAELARTLTQLRYGAAAASVGGTPAYAAVQFEDASCDPLLARLAVVADGTGAAVSGSTRKRLDYGQVAVLAKIGMSEPHAGLAYERFTPQGPIALLPESDHYSLVWTMPPAQAQRMLTLPDDEFLEQLAHHFGARVRGFETVHDRKSFPLMLEFARPTTTGRCALIGNASQTLHPVAGQGFNLGLRDAFELAQAINGCRPAALGDRAMLAEYAARRRVDRYAGIAFTHGLLRVFANDTPLLRWPRGFALSLLDSMPLVKKMFSRSMLFGLT
ncbi:MAG: FAD-dependent monooxygenase [Burkholderiales bacterium]|nr:FAD-dependent monooxygenase [Burkholderiales bacterium]